MNPIKEHPTWNIIDSTKLQCYMSCPRKYFYNYMLGWDNEQPSIHLEFGQAWHLAMETLLKHGYTEDNIERAHTLLTQHYRKFWTEIMDDTNYPKNPGFAYDMLHKYCKKYKTDWKFQEVLYLETSGTVPVANDRILYFKTDSIMRGINGGYGNKVFSREHKTASRRGNKWSLKMQAGTYNHVLYCLYGPQDVCGVEINEAYFQKTNPDFERTLVLKGTRSMNVWLWTVNRYLDMLEADTEALLACNAEEPILDAFVQNYESCNSYGSCVFYDYCVSWHNPLQHIDQIPTGMTTRFWNPAEIETTNKMNIT